MPLQHHTYFSPPSTYSRVYIFLLDTFLVNLCIRIITLPPNLLLVVISASTIALYIHCAGPDV